MTHIYRPGRRAPDLASERGAEGAGPAVGGPVPDEAMFRGLLESAPDAIVIVDADGAIALVNSQAERLFGYDRDELIGLPVEILLPERARDRHVRHRDRYFSEPRTRPMGAGLPLAGRRKD